MRKTRKRTEHYGKQRSRRVKDEELPSLLAEIEQRKAAKALIDSLLQFAVGEFDMVVANPESATCEIYEIKHSEIVAKEQYRHLKDAKKCRDTEFRYGTIASKNVIYRGASQVIDGINYLNVEEYLRGL